MYSVEFVYKICFYFFCIYVFFTCFVVFHPEAWRLCCWSTYFFLSLIRESKIWASVATRSTQKCVCFFSVKFWKIKSFYMFFRVHLYMIVHVLDLFRYWMAEQFNQNQIAKERKQKYKSLVKRQNIEVIRNNR